MATTDEKVVKVGRLKTFWADALAKMSATFAAKSHTHSYLPLSGGTLTGNLSGKYIAGTWLQATASNHSSTKQSKIVVQDANGWLYYRTPDEMKADIGAAGTSAATQSAAGLMSASDKKKLDGMSDSGSMTDEEFIAFMES